MKNVWKITQLRWKNLFCTYQEIKCHHKIGTETFSQGLSRHMSTTVTSPSVTKQKCTGNGPTSSFKSLVGGVKNLTSETLGSSRWFSTSCWRQHQETVDGDLLEALHQDEEFADSFQDHYLLPTMGHRVIVIQPEQKWMRGKGVTNASLQLDEACALIGSLPRWEVVDKGIFVQKSSKHKKMFFSQGIFGDVMTKVNKCRDATAVFVGVDVLNPVQLAYLQQHWKRPVYDRYTIVLQIFKCRAQTAEAKLQVSLAEIPYLRSRLRGMHDGTLDQQRGGMASVGGSGETFLETRHRILKKREGSLAKALETLKSKRSLLKKGRKQKELPVVAVVGYTNAGKTSLIKALTNDKSMLPRDQLFATLDVTTHSGTLPSHKNVLFIDTVGFISDIPTELIASFAATLEDMLDADLILHVQDISHPDHANQHQTVMDTLAALRLPENLQNNIIHVANKTDLLTEETMYDDNQIPISVTKKEGFQPLIKSIDQALIESTGRVRQTLQVPMNGNHLQWLYKEASIISTSPSENSTEHLMVDVVFTAAQFAKFTATFGKGRKKRGNSAS